MWKLKVNDVVKKKKKPKFLRQIPYSHKRLKKVWRKPRGSQSKMRKKERGKATVPAVGWRTPKKIRGLHPSGYKEVAVHSIGELEKIDTKKEAVRIATRVGKRKRAEIVKKAKEMKIKILNPGK